MQKTISDVKQDLIGMSHGGTLNKVKNIYSLLERAGNNFLSNVYPVGVIRDTQITGAVHDDVYDYSAPADLSGLSIIDLKPQINRNSSDNPFQRFLKEFDYRKENNSFAVRYKDTEKYLRMAINTKFSSTTLHNINSVDGNGTWSAGEDTSNVTADSDNYISGNASLNFDLDGSSTSGYVENDDMNSVDLSEKEDKAKIFVRVYIPDTSKITSFTLRWGSSSSAYWSDTVTSPFNFDSFVTGWNILAFEWNGASETGSPDSSAVDYLRFTVTYDGNTDTDYRIDKIVASVGEIYDLVYYSEYLFRSSAGVWSKTVETDTDIVNIVTAEGYNIYLMECLKAMAHQKSGEDASFDINFSQNELNNLYAKYKRKYPSQVIKPRKTYYRI